MLDSTTTNTAAFIYTQNKGEGAIGLIKDGFYYEKTNKTKKAALYGLNTNTYEDIKANKLDVSEKMDSLLLAYYYTTKYLYFNNKKQPKPNVKYK